MDVFFDIVKNQNYHSIVGKFWHTKGPKVEVVGPIGGNSRSGGKF
jgi:hypothetical protein